MAFFSCQICQEDGDVLADEVRVTIEETERGGATEWYGTIMITHLTALTAGEHYLIKLPDGRKGQFTVRRNTFAGDTNRAVAIHGLSPLA